MTIETCRVCQRSEDGGAGSFTSDEGVCQACYADAFASLEALCREFGDATVIGLLASAAEALGDRIDSTAAERCASSLTAAAVHIKDAGTGEVTLADACRVLADACRVLGDA